MKTHFKHHSTTILAALVLICGLCGAATAFGAITTVDDTLSSGGFTRDFAYHKPVGFSGDTAIVCFHGMGNNGRQFLQQKWWARRKRLHDRLPKRHEMG